MAVIVSSLFKLHKEKLTLRLAFEVSPILIVIIESSVALSEFLHCIATAVLFRGIYRMLLDNHRSDHSESDSIVW